MSCFHRLGSYDILELEKGNPLPRSRLKAWQYVFQLGRLSDLHVFYQTTTYALHSLRDGTRGLWWNPYQNCGQPFLGRVAVAQLYPLFVPSLVGGGSLALWIIAAVHLVIGGGATYLLCRELGAGRIAALCGAITFQLGNTTMEMTVWNPYATGAYVWLPAAMLFCERALRRPTAANAVGLGVALALALLAGFPQTVFYAYMLIGLRLMWELATRRTPGRGRALLAVGIGLVLAPLLAGLQLIPAIEVGLHSARGGTLHPSHVDPTGILGWRDFRLAVGARASLFQPLVLIPCLLAASVLLARTTWRRGLFYVVAGLLFFVLALGPSTPLLGWYLMVPLTAVFRFPHRFMWIAALCVPVVTGLGAQAVLERTVDRGWGRSVAGAAVMFAVLVGFHLLAPDGLRPLEWALGVLVIAACLTVGRAPIAWGAAAAVILAAVVVNHVAVPVGAWQMLYPSGESVLGYAATFTRLRARMTAQDRAYFNFDFPLTSDYGLTEKSASVFEVPSFFDYDPQITERYADFLARLRGSKRADEINLLPTPPNFDRRLLDLAAGRYVLAEVSVDNTPVAQPGLRLIEEDEDVRLYENPWALPRARYVSRIEVEEAPSLLQRLASGGDDLREMALVEAPPPSGFLGESGSPGPGRVEFLRNEPEHLVLHVRAPARGFVVLADQYFPGWQATVNDTPTPIVRANYVFRVVEVPAGESRVEFRYAPGSVRLGAWVSGLTLLGVVGVLVSSRTRKVRAA